MNGRDHEPLAAARRIQQRAAEPRAHGHHDLTAADHPLARVPGGESGNELARVRAELQGLRRAMATRAVIEQAKGILIATNGCDAESAFKLLRLQSQHENRKVHDVAADLVARHVGRPARRHAPSSGPGPDADSGPAQQRGGGPADASGTSPPPG